MSKTEHVLRIRITGDEAEIVGASKRASDAVGDVGDESRKTAAQLRHMDKASASASRNGHQLAGAYSVLKGAIAGLSVSYAAMRLIDTIGQTQQLNLRVKELSGTSAEYLLNQEYLRKTARDLRKDYFLLADSYADLLALQKGGILTQKESRQLLEGLTDTSAALGASNAQLGQSLFGLSQGLSSGKLKAEEFNQVVEPMPGLMQAIDKAAGLAAGGFRNLVNQGKVTSEYFKEILIKAFTEFEGAALRAGQTIPGAMTDIQNAYAEVVAQLEQPVSAALVPVLEALAEGLRAIPEYADEAGALLTILGSYAAVRYLPGLFANMTANIVAATRGFTRATSSVDVYGASVKNVSRYQRVFNASLAALGGPIGIVSTLLVAAAFEIATYTSESEKAIEATRNWGQELEETQSIFERFLASQKAVAEANAQGLNLQQAKIRYREVATEVERLTSLIQKLEKANASLARRNKAELQLQTATAELAKLKSVLGSLATAPDKAIESLEKLTSTLKNQVAVFGKSKGEARLFNVEQKILEERARLGTTATKAQVLQFDEFAKKARESATALNELEQAQSSFKKLQKENQGSAKVIDLATERAKQLEIEANNYAASESLRQNAHQQRLAQIKGHLSEESLLKLQQFDLEQQAEIQRYANSEALAEQQFQSEQQKLAERHLLATQNYLLSEQQRQEIFAEIEAQQDQLEIARRQEKEAATLEHEQKITDIKRRELELRALLEQQQHDRWISGAAQLFGNLAAIHDTESKKGFEKAKKWKKAQALIHTYSSAVKAYDSLADIPYIGPALGAAAAAAAIAAGLANVRKIDSAQFGGGAASAGGAVSTGGAGAPTTSNVASFNPPPQQQTPTQREEHAASNFQNGGGLTVNNNINVAATGNDDQKLAEAVVDKLNDGSVSAVARSRFVEEITDEVLKRVANG